MRPITPERSHIRMKLRSRLWYHTDVPLTHDPELVGRADRGVRIVEGEAHDLTAGGISHESA